MSQTKTKRAGVVATRRVQRGMHHARRWSAPRIEGFADVVETRITPVVTSTLRTGATKVKPDHQASTRIMARSMMSWRGLVALIAALGTAGAAAGIAMRKRYSSATIEAEKASTDATTSVPAQGGEPVNSDEPVNDDGRVSSRW